MMNKGMKFIVFFMMTACMVLVSKSVYSATYVKVDGSSTVYPITEAVAEEFQKTNKDIRVTVGISGTGGGFKKFCRGETDISDASRPIKESEIILCKEHEVEYIELPIAYDGLAVIVNPQNDWLESITVDELKKIWEPEAQGAITRWNQVRYSWPNEEIKLYGPGTDSGTYDYFTEAINGKQGSSRGDYTSSEDDNILVYGVAGDKNGLGYFGLAYYEENASKLKLVAVDGGGGPVLPTQETVNNGTYQPLSRPIFIYVSKKAMKKPEVQQFVQFYLQNAPELSQEVGYVPLPQELYELATMRFELGKTGSAFAKASKGMSLEAIMRQ